ncbi:hypothetical protein KJ644_02060 [Candidatus Dependentiae bacterium]|nr:hypothetical protein [Candidatus Dependentiae bacterium]MBU4387237.1 hypothetical protein [Candidatus Dependentiae bacterium]MCG2755939.1 hypothetical protein [Candidatus Dependentiae bacterium]
MNKAQTDKKWFLEVLNNNTLITKLKQIKIIITDIDGCLTDASLMLAESQYLQDTDYSKFKGKSFCVQDGFGISTAIKNNLIKIAFISGRTDEATKIRAKMLGIPDDLCFTGIDNNKIEKIKLIQNKYNISKEEILYFGDDLLDFQTVDATGIMTCPANTLFYFQNQADLIIPRVGGNGAFRILLDLVLYVQNKHFAQEFIDKSLK